MKAVSRAPEGLWTPVHGSLRPRWRAQWRPGPQSRRLSAPPRPPRAQAAVGGRAAGATAPQKPATLAAAVEALQSRLEAAVLAEAEEQKREMEAAYARASDSALQREGIALLGLKASACGRLLGDMVWKLELPEPGAPLPRHKFRPGAGLSLRASGSKRGKGLEAMVLEVAPDHLLVTVAPEVAAALTRNPPGVKFRVEQGACDATTGRQLEALARLSQMPEPSRRQATLVRAILLGSPKGAALSAEPPEWAKSEAWRADAGAALAGLSGINESQRKAVAAALTRCFTLWQGPPGTGKTRTLLAFLSVVCGAAATPHRRAALGPALAVAETNTAADNLLSGLVQRGVAAVRVGRAPQVRPELREWCVDAVAERSPAGQRAAALRDQAAMMMTRVQAAAAEGRVGEREVAQAQREVQRLWAAADGAVAEAAQAALRRAQVVVGTCAAAGEARLAEMVFKLVVVDEATQATEPSALVALTKGAECVVMAGDHAQLPPTVISQAAAKAGLGVPLFARLQTAAGMPALLLSIQYRMHPAIAEFPSRQFYQGRIASGVTAAERPLPGGPFPWPARATPVALLPCEGREERASAGALAGAGGGGASYRNPEQAEVTVRAVRALLADPGLASLAVLTAYTGQARLLTIRLQEELPPAWFDSGRVVVSTIDGFQGREAEAVVISTVRSNPLEKVGFLADARRMNVAITRAKRALVVVGSPRTLAASPHWAAWLGWVRERGVVAATDI